MTAHGLSIEERFWSKVDFDGPVPEYAPHLGPCWLWTAARNAGGYGSFAYKTSMPKQTALAHRVAFVLLNGFWPPEVMDHLCRVRNCVNLAHLEAVTPLVNAQRGFYAMKTHCLAGHEFTPENTLRRRDGTRFCRACSRNRGRIAAGWTGGLPHGERTHCPKGHTYDAENTYRIPSTGSRLCRACQREHSRTRVRLNRQPSSTA